MAYLGSWAIDDWLTFYANTHQADTAAATDADAVPPYRIYEDETGAAILTGNMALLDAANTTGFYSERVQLTAANGFEVGKQYAVYISPTVNVIMGTIAHTFQMLAEVNAAAIEGADPTDTIRDAVVDDATRIDATQLNTHSAITAAGIVNEWETQSQADPTGFHVNVLEIESVDATDQIRDAVVDDATRIGGTAINALTGVANISSLVVDAGGNVASDVVEISGDSGAADNLELDYDGTGYAKANSTIGTTTLNTDMVGTDNALLAASAPANWGVLSITAITGRVDVAEIEGADATDQIRDSVLDDATRFSGADIDQSLSTTESNIRGADNDDLKDISDEIDAVPTATENADGLLRRDWTAVAAPAARSVLNALRFLRNRWRILAGTLTVYEEDDATPAWTGPVTTAASDPVNEIDPT